MTLSNYSQPSLSVPLAPGTPSLTFPPEYGLILMLAGELLVREERPLPKLSWQRAAGAVLVFVALTASIEWLAIMSGNHWLIGVPFIVACGLAIYYFGFRRCPQCYRRLVVRQDMFGPTQFRVVYDCEHCQIIWDSGLTGDTRDEPIG